MGCNYTSQLLIHLQSNAPSLQVLRQQFKIEIMIYSAKDLSIAYDGNVVLDNLNFSVEAGDYFCIAGENGSGKSTLIKGLLKLIKPASGTLQIGRFLKDKTGYLPQQTALQKDFPAGVFEVVLSGRISKKGFLPFYTAKDKAIADENLQRLHVFDLKYKCFRELSGGQQRRVLLARSLCAAEKLLILDEPAAGLDPIATQEMYALLKKINVELMMTIIMVTHDISCVINYADKILHLQNKQVFFGTVNEYIESESGKTFMKTNGNKK
ncbi:MAG: ABC transporter ATP-binding protein [Termitinemataceae bacterium]|nr:MAG: ABC transporter ATP-binding protein [Termitinemataceae bacterium]